LDSSAVQVLCEATWPGNVRELENLCRRLTVLAPGATVTTVDLPSDVSTQLVATESSQNWQRLLEEAAAERFARGQKDVLSELGPDFERVLLRTALGFTGGRKQEAARWIGWGRNTLTRKLKELDVD